LAKALQSAEDDGVVSPQEIHQLMAQARGAGMLRSGDGTKAGDLRAKAGNLWEQGKVLWGQPFALAEQFNRRSTFIASYRTPRSRAWRIRRLSPARRCWKRSSSIPRQQAQVGARRGRRHAVHLQDLLGPIWS
jgi:hypothetical protein